MTNDCSWWGCGGFDLTFNHWNKEFFDCEWRDECQIDFNWIINCFWNWKVWFELEFSSKDASSGLPLEVFERSFWILKIKLFESFQTFFHRKSNITFISTGVCLWNFSSALKASNLSTASEITYSLYQSKVFEVQTPSSVRWILIWIIPGRVDCINSNIPQSHREQVA